MAEHVLFKQNPSELSDKDLVQLTRDDAEYFGYLMDRYEKRLIAYVHRLLKVDNADAEDILQETFIKAYTNINEFDTDLKFSSWIYRITHNQAISYYRKQKARPEHISSEDAEVVFQKLSSDLDIKIDLDKKFHSEYVQKLLEQLNPKYRDVLILKFLEDKDYKEISDILKKPMGTIATLMNRAKKQFKKILINEGHGA